MLPGCGACSLCCTLLNVPDIHKPAGMMCWWTTVHGGCKRHAEKPDPEQVRCDEDTGIYSMAPSQEGKDLALLACATFKCQWLIDVEADPERGTKTLRPDICHVVIGPQHPTDPKLMFIQVDPRYPTAWRAEAVQIVLNSYIEKGAELEIIVGESRFRLPDRMHDSATELAAQ